MTLLVDTSVWSLAFRRDRESRASEAQALRNALQCAETVVTTGLVLQELLQGFSRARAYKNIVQRFSTLPLIAPAREDHIKPPR